MASLTKFSPVTHRISALALGGYALIVVIQYLFGIVESLRIGSPTSNLPYHIAGFIVALLGYLVLLAIAAIGLYRQELWASLFVVGFCGQVAAHEVSQFVLLAGSDSPISISLDPLVLRLSALNLLLPFGFLVLCLLLSRFNRLGNVVREDTPLPVQDQVNTLAYAVPIDRPPPAVGAGISLLLVAAVNIAVLVVFGLNPVAMRYPSGYIAAVAMMGVVSISVMIWLAVSLLRRGTSTLLIAAGWMSIHTVVVLVSAISLLGDTLESHKAISVASIVSGEDLSLLTVSSQLIVSLLALPLIVMRLSLRHRKAAG